MFFNWNDFRYMQYLSVCIATMTITSVAMYGAWPSPILPKLKDHDSPLPDPITDDEGSWIVSISTLATPPSCLLAAWVINKFGRKGSLLLFSVILFIPWIIMLFATTWIMICVARLIGGIAFGCVYTATAMYSGEIADSDIRGKLGLIISLMKLIGTFIVLSIGPFVTYEILTVICAVMPIIFFILMIPMPESPYHLVIKGKHDDAREVLRRLSSKKHKEEYIVKRMIEIEETIANDMGRKGTLWEVVANSEYRYAVLISIGVKTLNQFCGAIAIDSYMQTIIEESGSSISPEISSIIFGVVQIPAAIVATFLVDSLGRKPLLLASSLGCAVAMAAEGIYFYLQDEALADVSAISWLPTTGIVLFLVMNNIGITTVPMVLLSELFPTNIKGIAISVNTFYGSSLSFLVSKFFKPVSNSIGMHYTFFIFMGCCVLGVFFIIFCMPETKGKSFIEIQSQFNRKYIKKNQVDNVVARKECHI